MSTLWFIVPVHGRVPLADVCMRQLRRTCDALIDDGIEATAVLIGNARRKPLADELGFGFVKRDNEFLGRKFNDGFQFACDPEVNPRPADFAVPFGSDDWIDHRILLELPGPKSVIAFKNVTVVRPDGKEMTARHLDNEGGPGIRIYPRELVATRGYRPADEDRSKGCDTSIFINLRKSVNFSTIYRKIDPRQLVDWKSEKVQVTPYDNFVGRRVIEKWPDPFEALQGRFPAEALSEMRALYG